MKKITIVFVLLTLYLIAGCGGKAYYRNSNPSRNFNQDASYCRSVSIGSVQIPNMQQYQNNAYSYAPGSGTMRDQYGNIYRYQEDYNAMAAAQSNMAMAQQGFNNAAIGLQNMANQLEAQGARATVFNQCMSQLGWVQVSQQEYEVLNQQLQNPHQRFIQAAEQGNAEAQLYLARIYGGKGGSRQEDPAQAVKWMQKAAEQGEVNAQYHLGQMYAEGYGGLVRGDNIAMEWFRKAAEQGHPLAQDTVGYAYFNGFGVVKDENAAMEWYSKAAVGLRKAAEVGMAEAQYKLSNLLFNGFGVDVDKDGAIMWLKKSAEQGYPQAQDVLNRMRQDGLL